jgi:3-phenylpropionate/trans-cinnamate dioxygenase ferredoxin component
MPDLVAVARTDEVPPGTMKLVDLAGQEVVVANVGGAFYAFANECTHAGGPLAEGELDGDKVTCPWHFTTFDVKTGQPLSGPGNEPVATYQTEVVDGQIRIAPPA